MIARDRQKQSIYTHRRRRDKRDKREKRDEETESLRSSIRQRTKDRQVRTTRICLAWEKDRIRSSEAELTKVRLAREREKNSSVHYGKKKEKESWWTIDTTNAARQLASGARETADIPVRDEDSARHADAAREQIKSDSEGERKRRQISAWGTTDRNNERRGRISRS